jgi:hypothetical protein
MNVVSRFCCLSIIALIGIADLHAHAADTDRSIRWLKETPVSLWEYGLMRLEKHVSGWSNERSSNPLAMLDGMVVTNQMDNHIIISGYTPNDSTKERCKKYLTAIREDASIRDGELLYGFDVSNYATLFINHVGTGPRGYLKHVDEVITIQVVLRDVKCVGPLVSSEIDYQERE